jgi:hypothetical protein
MSNKTSQKKLDSNKKYRESHREAILYHKRNNRLRRFGMQPCDLDHMLIMQDYKCAICGIILQREGKQNSSAHIDHCHTCGKVRKLLCKRCNTFVGFMESNEDVFYKTFDYFVEHWVNHEKNTKSIISNNITDTPKSDNQSFYRSPEPFTEW